jgi:hypothetical protein
MREEMRGQRTVPTTAWGFSPFEHTDGESLFLRKRINSDGPGGT